MSKLKIQIIGPVGSGKTTIANLIFRALEGKTGELRLVDDVDRQQDWVPEMIIEAGGLATTDVLIETIQIQRNALGSP